MRTNNPTLKTRGGRSAAQPPDVANAGGSRWSTPATPATFKTRETRRRRPGYTLVEMLVAVTLVLLMMLMFAEIFQIATGSISAQRGLAENDQAARTLTTILRADLDKRTFRSLVPFFLGEDPKDAPISFAQRRGYFYISENDPDDDGDDVLQFTVRSVIRIKNKDESRYFGRATALSDSSPNAFLIHPNQPDHDDGSIVPDRTASSTSAEISIFLRAGILYRRVLLIREPLNVAGTSPQPTNFEGLNFFDTPSGSGIYPQGSFLDGPDGQPGVAMVDDDGNGTVDDATEKGWLGSDDILPINQVNNFYNDFDFSARLDSFVDALGATVVQGAKFAGIDDLDNAGNERPVTDLGNPPNRFGHNYFDGLPREFASDAGLFIGRFTHAETSHSDFNYPQDFSSTGVGNDNPMDATGMPLTYASDGVVEEFRGGPRRGEDILLTNVHAFDVKVWDDRLDRFVDVGHQISTTEPGDYHFDRIRNLNYGPTGSSNKAVLDTWHPLVDLDDDPTTIEAAPFRAMTIYPDNSAESPVIAGVTQPAPVAPAWVAGNPYSVGDIVFPIPQPPGPGIQPTGNRLHYECIDPGSAGLTEPKWPVKPGKQFTDGTVTWQSVNNLRPVKAIQLTIRYLHVNSGQMRQVTLVHSLID